MRLTPIDLINKRFPSAVKGYSRGAVEEFLWEAAADYEGVVAENARLRDSIEALDREVERFRSIEKTLQDALLLAQRTADDLRATSRREADAILNEARTHAETETEDARRQLEDLRQQRARFTREFRALLRSHMDGLGCETHGATGLLDPAVASPSGPLEDSGTGELAAGR